MNYRHSLNRLLKDSQRIIEKSSFRKPDLLCLKPDRNLEVIDFINAEVASRAKTAKILIH
jgi:hypothetical protein